MAEEVGLMPAPEGVTPDFHSVTYLQRTIITVYSVTFAIATITLFLRFYTGVFIVRKLGLDAREFLINAALPRPRLLSLQSLTMPISSYFPVMGLFAGLLYSHAAR